MATPYLVSVYVIYAAISVALTIWLARTLFKNGAVFLRDVFADNPELSEAVNRLLVVGFYLVNMGYAALLLRANPAESLVGAIETLAFKLGLLLMSLAGMHFANMYLFHRIRRRAREQALPPPVQPMARIGDEHPSAFEMIRRRDDRAMATTNNPIVHGG